MAHKSLSHLDAFDFSSREAAGARRKFASDFEAEQIIASPAESAPGASPSPAELALDLVLNELLQQARLVSSATGAAVGLIQGSQMVCRAAAGATATEVAAHLAMDCKVVDTCLRSGNAQRSDDTEADPRFDAAACKRLGLRSVVVVPVKNSEGKTIGVVEIFSSRPTAFSDRDVLMLEGVAHRVHHNMEIARQVMPSNLVPPAKPRSEPILERRIAELPKQIHVPNSLRFWTRPLWGLPKPAFDSKLFLLLAAIALSLTLGWMLGRVHGGTVRAKVVPRVAATTPRIANPAAGDGQAAKVASPASATANSVPSTTNAQTSAETQTPGTADDNSLPGVTIARHTLAKRKLSQPAATSITSAPAGDSDGSLVIFEDPTKEKSSAPSALSAPAPDAQVKAQEAGKSALQRHSATIRVSPAEAQKNLIQRVEPSYPEEAKAQNVQGKVVLDIIVDKKGDVRGISKLSGDPQLALASARAVQQWKFKPMVRDGGPIQFETRVTLNFSFHENAN